jgi:hypothetical protein
MRTESREDRGLGTTFERFSIYRWLESVTQRFPEIETVVEGPGDGMAGIPGIHGLALARQGCRVTVVLDNIRAIAAARRAWRAQELLEWVSFVHAPGPTLPLPDQSADLVWNFNRLPFQAPTALLAELTRLSRRYVALVVPNRTNYGFPARRLYHRRTGEPWLYGETQVMSPKFVESMLQKNGLTLREWRWIDVAWWPDIIDPVAWLEAMAPGAGPLGHWIRQRFTRNTSDQDATVNGGYRWTPETLPYFDPAQDALRQRMEALAFLERWPIPKRWFAHHFAVLMEKDDAHR